jgi:hypothetical protein
VPFLKTIKSKRILIISFIISTILTLSGYLIIMPLFRYPNIYGDPKKYGDEICSKFGRDDTNLTYSTEVCVSWDSVEFLIGFFSLSETETVKSWLKTELHARIIYIGQSFPGIHFRTNNYLGIFGFYVWDRIMNQSAFTVRYLQEADNIEVSLA